MRNFLLGVLLGVTLMGATYETIAVYRELNARVSRIEGYLEVLDHMLRGATPEPQTPTQGIRVGERR